MRKRPFVFVCIALELALGLALLSAVPAEPALDELAQATLIFSRVLQIVRQDYVSPEKTGYRDLIYAALRGVVRRLDPHCEFYDPVAYRQERYESRGEMSGLGIVVAQVSGNFTVVSSIENAPAARAGVQSGDQITAVNGTPTRGLTFDKLGRLLNGEPGQSVKLDLFRPATKQSWQLEIKRQVVQVPSVRDAHVIRTGDTGSVKIGYLRVTEFVARTAEEIRQKVDELKSAGITGLIVDLRFNPGGLVNSAVETSALFLPGKTVVVSTEGRNGSNRQELTTPDRDGPFTTLPVAILVNGETASAAEIVTGALQDWAHAIVVGETTFGKGVIQSEVPLPDGSAIKFTTAEYFTPKHNAIECRGVAPNIIAPLSVAQERGLLLQDRGAYLSADEKDLVSNFNDEPLARAVDALHGYLTYRVKSKG
jgi:carboxyl-terminal processing protease